jgi:hypothetical protein
MAIPQSGIFSFSSIQPVEPTSTSKSGVAEGESDLEHAERYFEVRIICFGIF